MEKIKVYSASLGKEEMMDVDVYLSLKRLHNLYEVALALVMQYNYDLQSVVVKEINKCVDKENDFLNEKKIWKEWKRVEWTEVVDNNFFDVEE